MLSIVFGILGFFANGDIRDLVNSGKITWTGSPEVIYLLEGAVSNADNYDNLVLMFSDPNSVGSFVLSDAISASAHILLVGGGGAGANPGQASGTQGGAGGGGAGGFVEETNLTLESGTYAISVGVGGVSPDVQGAGGNGSPSFVVFGGNTILEALGGGGGGIMTDGGRDGGSGGGGSRSGNPGSGALGHGSTATIARSGGGGGGAGAVGAEPVSSLIGGDGGAGRISVITGESVIYAAGGGGGSRTGTGGTGGDGVGGNGGGTEPATSGINGTGSGGGGGSYNWQVGGNGGSGVVIVRIVEAIESKMLVTGKLDRADLTYAEGDTVKVAINLSMRDGEDMYAFVQPLNEAATNCLSGAQVIGADGKATGAGVLVPGTGTVGFKTLDFTLLDGYCEPKFQVVLCSEETYDASKAVDRYTPVPLTIVCENVVPQGKAGRSLSVGSYLVTNNAALPAPVYAGSAVALRIDIADVAADRRLAVQPNEMLVHWINGADPEDFTNGLFLVKWAFYNPRGVLVDTRITVGSSRAGYADTNFTFTAIGDNEIAVQMLDKDMIKALLDSGVARSEIVSWEGGVPYGDANGYWESSIAEEDWGPEYRVTVPVADKASVSIVPVNAMVDADGTYGFNEGQTSGSFDIVLSTPAERPLTVKLWLERTARTEGAAQNLPTLGSFMLKDKELAMDTNEYVTVDFKRGVDRANVRIAGMDGTPYSQYALHAVVITTTKNDNGVPLNEFYTEGAYDFGVFNYPDPKLNSIMANVGISYNQSTGLASTNVVTLTQNQEVTIEWKVSDNIRMDETNNFTVTWNSTEPGSMMTTNNAVIGTYKTKFSTAGDKTITLSINDKDGGINFYEWNFNVMTAIYTATVGDVVWVYENYGETDARITGSQTVLTGNVVIPDAVNGRTVVAIAESALKNASGVTGITIPKSVMLIEDGAFAGLEEVLAQWYKSLADLVEGGSAYGIGSEAADQTIAAITVDSDTTIGDFVLSKDKVYDSVIYIVNTADHEINITLPAGYTYKMFKGAKPLKVPANSESVLTITRLAENVFLVSAEELETMK